MSGAPADADQARLTALIETEAGLVDLLELPEQPGGGGCLELVEAGFDGDGSTARGYVYLPESLTRSLARFALRQVQAELDRLLGRGSRP